MAYPWVPSLQIGVSVQPRAVVRKELFALFNGDFAFLDALGDPGLHRADEFLRAVLHVFQHVGHGLAVDDLVDVVALFVHGDVYGVGVAKQVVEVAEDFLVGTHEENTDIIMLLVGEAMQRDGVLRRLGDEVGDLAVAVAGDVLKGGQVGRVFVQTLDGDDGEELVDGPEVGQRLEQGEVAEVFVGKQLRQRGEVLGHALQAVGDVVHLTGDAPEQAFDLGARLEVEQAEAEQVEGLFADLLGVVPDFQRGAFGELVPRLVKFLDEFVVVFLGFLVVVPFGQRGLLQHLEDEHGVVRRQGTTRLADDVGVGEFVLVAGIHDGVDGVVGILLDAVVDRAGTA